MKCERQNEKCTPNVKRQIIEKAMGQKNEEKKMKPRVAFVKEANKQSRCPLQTDKRKEKPTVKGDVFVNWGKKTSQKGLSVVQKKKKRKERKKDKKRKTNRNKETEKRKEKKDQQKQRKNERKNERKKQTNELTEWLAV